MRSLQENIQAVIDLNVVLMIGIAFAGMIVFGFVVWVVTDNLQNSLPSRSVAGGGVNWTHNLANSTMGNITGGFDSAINLILVAITIFILALAISALLLLRARR